MNKKIKLVLLSLIIFAMQALADPPFITDSAEPAEYRQWQFYLFSAIDKTPDAKNFVAPALEIDWGNLPNMQLHLQVPFVANFPADDVRALGTGDVEAGFEYRFIQETTHRPQISIAPLIEIPTGKASRGLGNGRAWYKIPLLFQKSWGAWTSYGGGGVAINSAPGARNFPYGGLVVQKKLNDKLALGGEIAAQGAMNVRSHAYAILNAGGTWSFTKNFGLQVSIGHSIIGEEHLVAYAGLTWTV